MNAEVWTDETLVGAGQARIRDGAFAGRVGAIEAYAYGTVMLSGIGQVPLPFGLGEIDSISETKGDALTLAESKRMPRFLKLVSEWAEANGTAGRTITAEPDQGPGTMHWYAR